MARRKRRRALGSSTSSHEERARIAMNQAKRFIESANRRTIKCDARLQQVIAARSFADLAVHEAAHAHSGGSGPTALQTQVSRVSDEAIYASRHCAR